jgi:hypothetical protein
MKSFKRHIKEASYEVKIAGLPDMYIDSKSPVTIKKQLRKQLRQPDDLVSITRITKADKINVFRDRIRSAPLGEHDDSKDSSEYDQEGDMAKGQLKTMMSAAKELENMLGDDDNLPEWVQSKITKATDYIDSVRDYLKSERDDNDDD